MLIEGDRLRLVSMDGLPARLRGRDRRPGHQHGRRADAVRQDGDDGDRRIRPLRRPDLVRAARAAHDHAEPVARGRPPVRRALRPVSAGARSAMSSSSCSSCWPGTPAWRCPTRLHSRRSCRQRAHERAVIDASADGIAVLDRDGLVRQWNPAAHPLTGVIATQAIGKPPPFPLPEPGAKLTYRLRTAAGSTCCAPGLTAGTSRWSTSATSRPPRNLRRPRTCSWPRRVTSCGRRSPWCRASRARWRAAGTSCPTPTGAARCRPSPSGPSRWPGWSISCCSAPAPVPTS